MADQIPIISRYRTQLAYGWAEACRYVRRSLQPLIPSAILEDANLFGSTSPDARIAYRRGWACMDANVGLYDKAIGWFSKAISLDRKFTQAWLGRAQAYLKIPSLDNAIVDLTTCLSFAECETDTRYQALLIRASLYKKKGEFSRALKDLTEAMELKPGSINARLHRSAVYLDLKRLKEAQDDADIAMEMEPENPFALAQLGLVQSAFSQHQQAVRTCGRAISAAPMIGYSELFMARAAVLLADGRPTESLMDANEAVQRGGGIRSYIARAKTHIALELWDDAISDLTTAYNLSPDDCEILLERAFCFEQLAKYEQAIRDRAQALRIKGNCDEAIAAFEQESKQILKLRKSAGDRNEDWDSDQSL